MQAYGAFSVSCIAEGTLRVAALVAFVVLGLGIAWGAVAFMVGFAASTVCVFVYLIRRFGKTVTATVKYDWKRIAVASGGAAALTICTTLLGSLDVVLVKHYFDSSQAGIYSIASLAGKILLYFVGFIPVILLPQATDRHSRGERTRFVLAVCLGAFAIVALCGLTFFNFFGLFVLHTLAGHAYDAAASLLVPYCGAMVCLSLIGALGTYGIATHRMLFAFPLPVCTAAIFAAIGGAMFTLEVGFMSPSFVGIVPSIEMVIYTAVGGRTSIFGAIYGSLLVNFAKTSLSESFPQLWLFGLGALFIAVVLAFPNGLSGIWADYVQPHIDRLLASRKSSWSDSSVADGAPAE